MFDAQKQMVGMKYRAAYGFPNDFLSASLSPKFFVKGLQRFAEKHHCCRHHVLENLGQGAYQCFNKEGQKNFNAGVVAKFLAAYQLFTKDFKSYLKRASRFLSPKERIAVEENVAEESGSYGDEDKAMIEKTFGVDPKEAAAHVY
jgi:hypothetical protein